MSLHHIGLVEDSSTAKRTVECEYNSNTFAMWTYKAELGVMRKPT